MFYEEPKFEVILLEEADIICTSDDDRALTLDAIENGEEVVWDWSNPF